LRSHQSIELLQKKALVAAKAWVSLYRKLEIISNLGGVIIHTRKSTGLNTAGFFRHAQV
jgi:hypothetical protein